MNRIHKHFITDNNITYCILTTKENYYYIKLYFPQDFTLSLITWLCKFSDFGLTETQCIFYTPHHEIKYKELSLIQFTAKLLEVQP